MSFVFGIELLKITLRIGTGARRTEVMTWLSILYRNQPELAHQPSPLSTPLIISLLSSLAPARVLPGEPDRSRDVGRDREGTHRMRVALRRLRHPMGLPAPRLGLPTMKRLTAKAKWLAGKSARRAIGMSSLPKH